MTSTNYKKLVTIPEDMEIPPVMMNEKDLIDCTYENTPRFNFKDKFFNAKCVKVYDGDTITVVFMVFGELYKFSIRMSGYDSPELRSRNPDTIRNELETKWGYESRDFLSELILNKIVLLKCENYDKYGRILGTIELNGVNINNIMLTRGYCRQYDGGHKDDWDFSPFDKLKLDNDRDI
jgi:endonuclease YncB( thermonuclease family)